MVGRLRSANNAAANLSVLLTQAPNPHPEIIEHLLNVAISRSADCRISQGLNKPPLKRLSFLERPALGFSVWPPIRTQAPHPLLAYEHPVSPISQRPGSASSDSSRPARDCPGAAARLLA